MEWLIANTQSTAGVTLTYPIVYDSVGTAFASYDAEDDILPSIFLIDQTGIIQLRFDGADEPDEFLPELDEITSKIDELLGNPPGNL